MIVQAQTYLIFTREVDQAQWENQPATVTLFAPTEILQEKKVTEVEIILMSGTALAVIRAELDVMCVISSVVTLYSSTVLLRLLHISLLSQWTLFFIQFDAEINSQQSNSARGGHYSHMTSLITSILQRNVLDAVKKHLEISVLTVFGTKLVQIITGGWRYQL